MEYLLQSLNAPCVWRGWGGGGRDAGNVSVYKTLHCTKRLVESQCSNFNILFPEAFLNGAVMSLSCSPKLDNI